MHRFAPSDQFCNLIFESVRIESLIAALHQWLIMISSSNLQHPTDSMGLDWEWKPLESHTLGNCYFIMDKHPFVIIVASVWVSRRQIMSQHNIVTNAMLLSRPVTRCHEYQPQITTLPTAVAALTMLSLAFLIVKISRNLFKSLQIHFKKISWRLIIPNPKFKSQ